MSEMFRPELTFTWGDLFCHELSCRQIMKNQTPHQGLSENLWEIALWCVSPSPVEFQCGMNPLLGCFQEYGCIIGFPQNATSWKINQCQGSFYWTSTPQSFAMKQQRLEALPTSMPTHMEHPDWVIVATQTNKENKTTQHSPNHIHCKQGTWTSHGQIFCSVSFNGLQRFREILQGTLHISPLLKTSPRDLDKRLMKKHRTDLYFSRPWDTAMLQTLMLKRDMIHTWK